jgi:type VII secretion integral membrane protein EccD
MPAPTSGLARITIRAPRRRLDLAVPDQVPLAEILPEVLRRAGETTPGGLEPGPGGWTLRRADGASLGGATPLAHQGVRDGDVLFLVPRSITWPEPTYDDVVEEIAANARRRGWAWDASATRLVSLAAAGLVLLAGLVALLALGPTWTIPAVLATAVAVALLAAGCLVARAVGDAVVGAAAGGFALPYAAAGGALLLGGDAPLRQLGLAHVLLGSVTLLFASMIGAIGVGFGLRIFAAGATAGAFGAVGALLGSVLGPDGAAAVLVVALVAGIGAAPVVAVRLGRLPLPVVSAEPELPGTDPPDPDRVRAAVVRADELLAGSLLGISVVVLACAGVLGGRGGLAGPLLAGLAAVALLLRARLFPTVGARLPLLLAGLLGLALVAVATLARGGALVRLAGVGAASIAVVALLSVAATAYRGRGPSPYLGRLGDVLDVLAVVGLAPVACAVLDLYAWVRGLAG